MKKCIYLILLFLTAQFCLMAEDQGSLDIKLSGEVITSYVFNIDYLCNGLDTEATTGIKMDLNTEEYEYDSFEDFYGYLKISNMQLFKYQTAAYNSADPDDQAWETTPLNNTTIQNLNGYGMEYFNPEIEAKLMLGPVYIKIDNNIPLTAERKMTHAKIEYLTIKNMIIDNTDQVDDDEEARKDIADMETAQLSDPLGAIAVGHKNKLFEVEGRFATQTGARITENVEVLNRYNGFALGLEGLVKPLDHFTIDAGFYMSVNFTDVTPTIEEEKEGLVQFMFTDPAELVSPDFLKVTGIKETNNTNEYGPVDNPIMWGIQFAYDAPLAKNISAKPFLDFEGVHHDANAGTLANLTELKIGGGVDLHKPINTTWEDLPSKDHSVDMGEEFKEWTGIDENYVESSGATLYFNYFANSADFGGGMLNLKLSFFDDAGEKGFLPYVGLAGMFVANNLMNSSANMELGLNLFVNTSLLDKVLPFIHTDFWLGDYVITGDESLEVAVGAEISLLENALFTVKYISGNLLTTSTIDPKLGMIMGQVKISYN